MLALVSGLSHLSMTANSSTKVGTTCIPSSFEKIDQLNLQSFDSSEIKYDGFFSSLTRAGQVAYQELTRRILHTNKPKYWRQGIEAIQNFELIKEDMSKFDH